MSMGVGSRAKEKERHLFIYQADTRMNLHRNKPPQTLEVYLTLTDNAQALHLTFPPGYEATSEEKCGIVKVKKRESYDEYGHCKDLSDLVAKCEVVSTTEDTDVNSELPPRVSLKIEFISGIDLVPPQDDEDGDERWWYFGMHIWNPDVNPQDKDNFFELTQIGKSGRRQEGTMTVPGLAILGDWPCKFSDWQNWGGCSAQCGGGVMRQTREVLIEPPPDGDVADKPCTDVENTMREVPCNTFDCEMKCELVGSQDADAKHSALCSSECGGGLKAQRWRWRGENCPFEDDVSSAEVSTCNAEPCKVKCVLADTWTVVTECSELCGMGTYRMMRRVLKKDTNDPACQPEWKEVPCVRQLCTPLTVLRPDRHVWPLAGDWYRVGLAFKLDQDIVKIILSAPLGFAFGKPGSPCKLKDEDHDMVPAFTSCKVGEQYPDGYYHQPHTAVLNFHRVLLKNQYSRYHFTIAVKNPPCPSGKYLQIGENGRGQKCEIPPSQNMWQMTFEEEGKTNRKTVWAAGYDLFNPKEDMPRKPRGIAELFLGRSMANEAGAVALDDNGLWRARAIFCSARFNECPDGSPCPKNGVCPSTEAASGLPVSNGDVDGSLDLAHEDAVDSEHQDERSLANQSADGRGQASDGSTNNSVTEIGGSE